MNKCRICGKAYHSCSCCGFDKSDPQWYNCCSLDCLQTFRTNSLISAEIKFNIPIDVLKDIYYELDGVL